MSETPCLRVLKRDGQKALGLVRDIGILSREFRVQRENDYLYIPLTREPLAKELGRLKFIVPDFKACSWKFSERVERSHTVMGLLGDRLPSHVLASLPRAIDFVGEVAVVEIVPELEDYKRTIGEAILKMHKKVKTVLAKSGAVGGAYRLRKFEIIGGEGRTETVHKEAGCVFHVDLVKAYFSPRLSYEHSRVASLVRSGETVVDMFAGIGGFSIPIAMRQEGAHVYAIDVNPDAFEFLKKNARGNRVEARVTPILGDAKQVVDEKLRNVADRVVMNLPEKSIKYVDAACKAIKPEGGIIHYYQFSDAPDPLDAAGNRLKEVVEKAGRRVERVLLARIVRGIAPSAYQVVVDAEVT